MDTHFQFANAHILWLLLLLPGLVPLRVFLEKRDTQLLSTLLPSFIASRKKRASEFSSLLLTSITIALLLFALARPQWGYTEIAAQQKGIDIVIAVDLSTSMLAEDVKPNRLSAAKRKITDFLSLLDGDRVALVSFAGTAFAEAPLTLDYSVIKSLVKHLVTELIPLPGSNLDALSQLSIELLDGSSNAQSQVKKGLLIFSDGEFDEKFLSSGLTRIEQSGVIPVLISIGSEKGAPIIGRNGFIRDKNNQLVISKASVVTTGSSFEKLGGKSITASLTKNDLLEALSIFRSSLDQTERDAPSVRVWNEYYMLPLSVALLIISYCWFRSMTQATLGILSFLFIPLFPQELFADVARAEKAFLEGDFATAISEYKKSLSKSDSKTSKKFTLHTGLANSYYRQGQFREALKQYQKAIEFAESAEESSKAMFNAANTLAQLGQLESASQVLEQAQKQTPDDPEITQNLEYIKKLIQEEDKKEEKKEQQQQQDKEQQEGRGKKDKKEQQQQQQQQQQKENDKSKGEGDQGSQSKSGKDKDKKKNQEKSDKGTTPPSDSQKEKGKEDTDKKTDKDTAGSPEETTPKDSEARKNQSLSQLNSIKESNKAKIRYRYLKGLQQIQEQKREPSDMEW